MEILIIFALAALCAWLFQQVARSGSRLTVLRTELTKTESMFVDAQKSLSNLEQRNRQITADFERVRPYLQIADADIEAKRIQAEAKAEAKEKIEKATSRYEEAGLQADKIIREAQARAETIGGDAYRALQQADQLRTVIQAMKNKIEGYGNRYLIPSYSLLDELGDAYSHEDAGQQLKKVREFSRLLMQQGRAASCSYVDEKQREMAIGFVLDAFNGKVDSILTRVKADNIGTLKQQILDSYALVNHTAKVFSSASITQEYVQARVDELTWACRVIELRNKEREEQRLINEKIREEERAQREFEKAKREAEKEEAAVRKAMDRLKGQIEQATEDQKQKYEAQLAELNLRLTEAEAKGQRALSMAQQTRCGHVYVISNVGSLGENVYKVGMTRRLEPLDRIRELGDASVPFPFDVHAMVYADDAPRLERELHRKFLVHQVNKVNPRKEFFRLTIQDIKAMIDEMGHVVSWTLASQAAEYRESQAIEQKISSDPQARQAWLEGQMVMDPVVREAGSSVVSAVGAA